MILKLPVSLLVLLSFLSLLHCFAGQQAISNVAPAVRAPGLRITVTGSGFTCSASLMTAAIGPLQASSIVVVSSSSMTMLMPSGTGVFLDLVLTFRCFSPNRAVTRTGVLSYMPSMSSVVPSTLDSARTTVLTVSGANFASPCSSATITLVGTAVAALCSVSTTTRLTFTLTTPELLPGNPVTVQAPVAASINTATTSASVSILLRPPSPPSPAPAPTPTPAPSSVAPSPGSSGTPSWVIALSALGGIGVLMVIGCVVARRNGLCLRKGHTHEPRYDMPPAFAPDNTSYFPHLHQPQAPRPKTIERDMATAPPSDSVEVGWAGYMAEYDGRLQQHMAPVGYSQGALPQRLYPYASGAAVEMEHAPPSGAGPPQWAGYMAAYDARLQGHISPDAQGYPSAPPATDSELAYNQAVGYDRS